MDDKDGAPAAAGWPPPGASNWPPPTAPHWPPPAPPGPPRQAPAPVAATPPWKRIGSAVAGAGALLAKFGAVAVKLKYAGVLITMVISIAAYAQLWGWSFAVGFVALLFVHEMGHWVEMKRQKIPATAPMFIPFLGAVIGMRAAPVNALAEAKVGLAGPLAGTAGSVVVALWSHHNGSQFLQALAYVGFFLNLFNLLPTLPLDGGRAVGALHPAIWLGGLIALLGYEIWRPSPIVPLILILGSFELWRRWRARDTAASRTYYALTAGERLGVAAAYLGLVALTVYGAHATYFVRHFQ